MSQNSLEFQEERRSKPNIEARLGLVEHNLGVVAGQVELNTARNEELEQAVESLTRAMEDHTRAASGLIDAVTMLSRMRKFVMYGLGMIGAIVTIVVQAKDLIEILRPIFT